MPARVLFIGDESDLIARIQKGDRKALLRLFDENRRPVGSLVTRNGGNSDDADDVLQESVVIAWERIRTGQFVPTARLGTFIYGVARRIWLRRLARARRSSPGLTSEDEYAAETADALESMVEREDEKEFASAFRRLEQPCRTLLLLYYWERLSMEEIGRLLGFANADTVKAKKYQCKERLRNLVSTTEQR